MSDSRADFFVAGGGISGISAAAELSGQAHVLLVEAERALGAHASGRSGAMVTRGYGNAILRALNAPAAHCYRADCCSSAAERRPAGSTTERPIRARRRSSLTPRSKCCRSLTPAGSPAQPMHPTSTTSPATDRSSITAGPCSTTAARSSQAPAPPRSREKAAARVLSGPVTLLRPRCGSKPPAPGPTRSAAFASEEDASAPGECWPDVLVLGEGLARSQEAATDDAARPLTTWAGLRTFAADRTPVCGRAPRQPYFFRCAGQGGDGFQIAPAMARPTADLISRRAPDLASHLVASPSPERFGSCSAARSS